MCFCPFLKTMKMPLNPFLHWTIHVSLNPFLHWTRQVPLNSFLHSTHNVIVALFAKMYSIFHSFLGHAVYISLYEINTKISCQFHVISRSRKIRQLTNIRPLKKIHSSMDEYSSIYRYSSIEESLLIHEYSSIDESATVT